MSLTDQAVRPPIDARTSGWRSDEGGASRWRGPATAAPRRRSGSERRLDPSDLPEAATGAPLPQLGAEQRRDVVHEQRAHGRLPVVARVVPGEDEALLRAARPSRRRGSARRRGSPRGGAGRARRPRRARAARRRRGTARVAPAGGSGSPACRTGPARAPAGRAARAARLTVTAAGARLVAQADVELLEEAGQLGGLRAPAPRGQRDRASCPAPGGTARGRRWPARRRGSRPVARTARRTAPPARRQRLHERPRTAVVRGGDAVDRVERPALALPQLAGRRGRPGALLAGPRLQAVGERRLVQEPGRAQPGEEVLGGAVEQRAAQQRDEPRAEWRVPEDSAPLERDRHARGAEHAAQGRRDGRHVARDDRDLLRRDAVLPDQPRDLRGDELELRTLPAALHQGDRGVGGGRVPARRRRTARRPPAARTAAARGGAARGDGRSGRGSPGARPRGRPPGAAPRRSPCGRRTRSGRPRTSARRVTSAPVAASTASASRCSGRRSSNP